MVGLTKLITFTKLNNVAYFIRGELKFDFFVMKFGRKHYEEPFSQKMVPYEKINKVNVSILL